MKISQKRTCNNCRAMQRLRLRGWCSLGYKTEGEPWDLKPMEPCPKPLTHREIIEIRKIMREEKNVSGT